MTPPRTIMSVHNFYQQPGGEDRVFNSEAELLENFGHSVIRYEERNSRIGNGVLTGITSIWNQASHRRVTAVIRASRPDVAHIHNTFPLISPSAYYAFRRHGVPVVQALSNFRMLCPGAALLRDGKPCEDCIEQDSLLPALKHRCYRNSLPATTAVAAMLTVHRTARTWRDAVDMYIAPSEFVRRKFIEGGFPAAKIMVKPHVVLHDPGAGEASGDYALYVGRLSEEKGVGVLAKAWETLPDIPLRVCGDGPLAGGSWPPGVIWLGRQPQAQIVSLMKNARVLIVPSECYEIGPLTIIEAFACGLPVIASDLGSMAERVETGRNGLLFHAGDAADLAQKVRWAFENPKQLRVMRAAARRTFEETHTSGCNYKLLLEVYAQAIENNRRKRTAAA